MAEREGFEPPIPVKVYTLSRRAPSATRPSHRACGLRFYFIREDSVVESQNPTQRAGIISLRVQSSLLLLLFLIRAHGCARQDRSGMNHEAGHNRFGLGAVGGTHGYRHAEFTLRFSFVDAARRRYIRIVASNRDANVAVGSYKIIGRIEGNPDRKSVV